MSTGFDVDVVVAGAGAAGLAAAIAAAQGGRDVVLLEANETFRQGSNTAMSTSMVPAAGSRWQQAIGIEDSPAQFLDDILHKTEGSADKVVAGALTEVAPRLVAWMADDCGIPLDIVTDFAYPGHSVHRCHAVPDRSGKALHSGLLGAATAIDRITLIVPMRLVSLERVGDRIAAVRATTPDGNSEEIRTPNVVLSTNGFAANPDYVRTYIPEIAGAEYFGGDGSTGDALDLGRSVGADVGFLDAYQGHGSLAVPHNILVTWATVMHGGFLVNGAGERFGDESVGYSEYAMMVLGQPGGTAWIVLDRRIDDLCRPFKDYQNLVEAKAIRWADDAAELADRTGCPADRLAASLEEAAEASRRQAADRFGRTHWESPLEPPYGAVKVTGALFHTQGGLKVDGLARVLAGGEPVSGLYAAGGAAIGISGRGAAGYLAGNGLLSALGLGFLAGRHISG